MASDSSSASLQETRICLPVATLSIHPADKSEGKGGDSRASRRRSRIPRSKSQSGLLGRSSRLRQSALSDHDASFSDARLNVQATDTRTGLTRSRSTKPILVTLAFSNRIYWKGVTSGRTKTLADFIGCSSLELTRLDDTKKWSDVESTVKPKDLSNGFGIELPGKLYGLARIKGLRQSGLRRDVKLVLSLNDEKLRDNLVEELRARVAPFKLLREEMKKVAGKFELDLSVEEITRRLGAPHFILRDDSDCSEDAPSSLIRILMNRRRVSTSASDGEESRYNSLNGPKSLPTEVISPTCNDENDEISPTVQRDRAQSTAAQSSGAIGGAPVKFTKSKRVKVRDGLQAPVFDRANNANIHGNQVIGGVATAAKMCVVADKADQVAATASEIADISRIVGAASSVFQLVVLGARVVAMFAEANRGIAELPKALDRVIYLLGHVLRSTVKILNPSGDVEEILEDHVFKVLQGTFELIEKIEEQLMRGKISRVINSNVVKEVEKDLDALEQKVPTVVNTGLIVNEPVQNVGSIPPAPMLTQFFVGRQKQLELLETVLNKYGCACISEWGGVGKTEFVAAFANQCDSKKVKGGVYWVNVGGSGEKDDVIEALVSMAEKLAGKKMPSSDRTDARLVERKLYRCLARKAKDGRWLLCIDGANNANDPAVSGILDQLAKMADPAKRNGWVIITSREGQVSMFDGMKLEQRIELPPLTKEQTACFLWRRMHAFKCSEKSHDDIMQEIERFGDEDPGAFSTMMRLCDKLGGIPLQIVQAARVLARFDDLNFKTYLELISEDNGKSKVEELLGVSSNASVE